MKFRKSSLTHLKRVDALTRLGVDIEHQMHGDVLRPKGHVRLIRMRIGDVKMKDEQATYSAQRPLRVTN